MRGGCGCYQMSRACLRARCRSALSAALTLLRLCETGTWPPPPPGQLRGIRSSGCRRSPPSSGWSRSPCRPCSCFCPSTSWPSLEPFRSAQRNGATRTHAGIGQQYHVRPRHRCSRAFAGVPQLHCEILLLTDFVPSQSCRASKSVTGSCICAELLPVLWYLLYGIATVYRRVYVAVY